MILFIFGDITFLLVFALMAGAGTVMMFAEWLLEHIVLIALVLSVKSFLLMGRELFAGLEEAGPILLTIALDIVRGMVFLWVSAGILSRLFDSSVFFLDKFFDLLVGLPLALLASEWPVCHLYEDGPGIAGYASALLELVSGGELLLVKLLF